MDSDHEEEPSATPFAFPTADPAVFGQAEYGKNADIFGGDSDLSEQEDSGDSDNEAESTPAPAAARARSRSRSASLAPEDEQSAHSSDGGDSDDGETYGEKKKGKGAEGSKSALSGLSFKKKKARSDGEGDDDEAPKKKKKKTKAKEKHVEEEEEEEVDPEVARRRALDARLDAIIKKPKNKGGSRKKGQGDDDLEAMNDEAIVRLRNEMYTAADADIDENEHGRFAVHKLRMLQNVVEMMQKVALAESLVENGILDAVKRWLEPLPDRSLPAINIQRPLFEILRTLSIETSALKSSGLGKIVYFYTKCKRVEPFVQRMANQLVSDWMRPIIRRSKLFTDKDDANDSDADDRRYRRKKPVASGSQGGEAVARRHARIPEMLTTAFKIAPEADASRRATGSGQLQGHSATGLTSKMKTYKKRLVAGQAASRRV